MATPDTTPAPEGEPATPPPPPQPTIHEAELESGPSGCVLRRMMIDVGAAVLRRQAGQNVVICGDSASANRRLANQIEAAVGPCYRAEPHVRFAGQYALPHYQQTRRSPPGPAGHTFYETARRTARRTT
jgi:hypothetical protein